MIASDVKADNVTSTDTVVSGRRRLKGYTAHGGASDGSVVLRDGGASGTVMLTIQVESNGNSEVNIPSAGILFQTDIHATLTNVAGFTAFTA